MGAIVAGYAFYGVIAVPALDPPRVPVTIGSVCATDATAADQNSVLDFLRQYESTLASGRVERIVGLYADFDPARRGELEEYFQSVVTGLEIRLNDVWVSVDGDRARVKFERTDAFTDRETGNRVEKAVSIARSLERSGPGWQMVLDGR